MSFWNVFVIFVPSGVTVALQLPMLQCSALTPHLLTILVGTGLMEMFPWTVGSFDVFDERLD